MSLVLNAPVLGCRSVAERRRKCSAQSPLNVRDVDAVREHDIYLVDSTSLPSQRCAAVMSMMGS